MTTKKKEQQNPKPDAMERYIAEIDRFADALRTQQASIKELEKDAAIAKAVLDEAREKLREAKDVEHSTVSLLLKFIRPGSIDVMPLFDTMEPAEEEVHGQHADEWRKEPIVVLDLSAAAMRALIDADIVLVGQLQDRILKGTDWAEALDGINPGMAEAIAAKLQQFIDSRSGKR
ncbi:MAG TPA: hypothetical protein VG713_12725 [Pirellulales bacterium]|nr:hypothetical protein [Pirellulales bacterium]